MPFLGDTDIVDGQGKRKKRLKNHPGTSIGLGKKKNPSTEEEITQRVKRNHEGKRGRKQVKNVAVESQEERRTTITPDTKYDEYSKRLTAFGG